MKKLFFILLLVPHIVSAQIMTFVYELKYKPDSGKDIIKSETYYLDIMGSQSVFRSENARQADSLMLKNGYWERRKITFDQLYVFKNFINKKTIKSITHPAMYDLYFIDINDKLDWQIQSDKMKIGDIECQKATVEYGGRNWTVWFNQSIPLQDGPYIFKGLPGLIVKISDDKGEYDFSLIETSSKGNKMFYLRKGKEISWDVYRKLQSDYYNDPFAEIKARNIKYKVGDMNGNPIDMSLREMTENIQKQMRENNNPIELNHKVDFK